MTESASTMRVKDLRELDAFRILTAGPALVACVADLHEHLTALLADRECYHVVGAQGICWCAAREALRRAETALRKAGALA